MAENDAQERTEQATPKRLEEARKKGQIPRSRDLSTAAVMLVGGAALYLLGGQITGQMAEMMRRSLSVSRDEATDSSYMLSALGTAAARWLVAVRAGARRDHAGRDHRAARARRLEFLRPGNDAAVQPHESDRRL